MAFDQQDRDRAIETHTLIRTYEKRLDRLEAEDRVLHSRITRVALSIAGLGSLFSGIFMYLKSKVGS